jgi:hypothetical protein
MPDIASVIQREREALIAETRIAQCPPFVAVNNMGVVAQYPSALRRDHKATVTPLANAKGAAVIADCPSLKSTCLWVGADNDRYREDYLLFLNSTYELKIAAIPSAYDVDHLYNHSRAQIYSLRFIRLALVSGPANRSHGASYEKDITRNEEMRVRKEMKLMDEISMMKYFGFLSPLRNDPRQTEVEAYANFAASKMGLEASGIIDSVQYLRRKASTPWARK